MKKRTSIIAILIAILLLGVGYAVVNNRTLTVNGAATVTADDSNFVVKFDQQSTFTVDATGAPAGTVANATRTSDLVAAFSVTGLTQQGDEVVFTYPIVNESETLGASLASPTVTFTNTGANEYFNVTATLSSNALAANGGTANLVVTVTVTKTPITADESTSGTVTVVASPTNS